MKRLACSVLTLLLLISITQAAFAGDKEDVTRTACTRAGKWGPRSLAQKWFETLLAFDGLPVPQWSRDEMNAAIDGKNR